MLIRPLYKRSKLLQAKLSPFQKTIPKIRQRRQFILRPRAKMNLYNDRLTKYFYFLHKQKNNLLNDRLVQYERRIDVALFRVNFCHSIRAARQLIMHGKVMINQKKAQSPNIFLKPGDIFSTPIRPCFDKKLSKKNPAFEVNYSNFHAVYLFKPVFLTFPFQFQ